MSLSVAEKFRHLVSNTPEFQNLVGATTPAAAADRIVSWIEDVSDSTPLPVLSIFTGATDWTKQAEPGWYQESGTIEWVFYLAPPAGGDDGSGEFETVRNQVTDVIDGILKLTATNDYMDLERIGITDQEKAARDRETRYWMVRGSADWGVTG